MILTGVAREQPNSPPQGERTVPVLYPTTQESRSAIGAAAKVSGRMYHHHPYSYHRAFSIASPRQHSYNFTYTTAAAAAAATAAAPHSHTLVQSQQQSQIQDRSQNQSQNHIVPVHALNQNSNISAASYSTGEKTSSSQALTQPSSATATGSVGYSFLSPNINRNIGNTSTPATATPSATFDHNTNSTCANNSSASAVAAVVSTAAAAAATTTNATTNASGTTNLPAVLTSYRKCMATNNSKKAKTEPILSQFHQAERFTFANTYVVWGEDNWKRVVFQDERKFNLDGPDGFSYYFHDLRNYERTLSQRPRGNSVYIYLIVTAGGPLQIEISNAKCKLQKSIETILRERSAIISKLGGDTEFILQDHNWIGNALPSAQEWLNTEGIKTQKWPQISHDLNIMENVWGWLIREVFDGGRKFSRKDDLIFRIRESWSRLPIDLITNLYSTLPERIMELYYTRGIYTNC